MELDHREAFDLDAARRVRDEAANLGRFVRVSSEFPLLPGVQRAIQVWRSGVLGKGLSIRNSFLHSSDLDPAKPVITSLGPARPTTA